MSVCGAKRRKTQNCARWPRRWLVSNGVSRNTKGDLNYLTYEDLQDRQVCVTIDHFELEVGCGVNEGVMIIPVLYFQDKKKRLALEAPNTDTLVGCFGSNPENWIGKEIVLAPSVARDDRGREINRILVRTVRARRPCEEV